MRLKKPLVIKNASMVAWNVVVNKYSKQISSWELVMHKIFFLAIFLYPFFSMADIVCQKGFQPYANRCISQRMADYISCVEASGGNKDFIYNEIAQSSGNSSGGKIDASGKGVVIKAEGALILGKKAESALGKR